MDTNDLIKAYSTDPINNFEMEDFSVKMEQGNNVCGDMIIVYLKIAESSNLKVTSWGREQKLENSYIIESYSFAGIPQMYTIAAASLLAEFIEWEDIETVLTWDYGFMKEHGFEVSPRRRRSAVSALLAVRNAIYEWREEETRDGYDDLI